MGGGCGEVVATSAGVPGSVPLGVAVDAGRCGPTSGVTCGVAPSARRLRGAREGEATSSPFPFPFGTREPYAGGGVISANTIAWHWAFRAQGSCCWGRWRRCARWNDASGRVPHRALRRRKRRRRRRRRHRRWRADQHGRSKMTKFGLFARYWCYPSVGIARDGKTRLVFHQGNGLFEGMPLQSIGIADLDVFVLYHLV